MYISWLPRGSLQVGPWRFPAHQVLDQLITSWFPLVWTLGFCLPPTARLKPTKNKFSWQWLPLRWKLLYFLTIVSYGKRLHSDQIMRWKQTLFRNCFTLHGDEPDHIAKIWSSIISHRSIFSTFWLKVCTWTSKNNNCRTYTGAPIGTTYTVSVYPAEVDETKVNTKCVTAVFYQGTVLWAWVVCLRDSNSFLYSPITCHTVHCDTSIEPSWT